MLTVEYDFWVHGDDPEKLNPALEALGLVANRTIEEARARGRYVLENGEHVDVLCARASQTKFGELVAFDDV